MEGRTFSNTLSSQVTGWTSGPFLVAAIAVAVQKNWMLGASIAIAGIALTIVMQTSRTKETVICDGSAVTVLIGRKPDTARTRTFTWAEVQATRYVERTVSAGANDCTIGIFTIEGPSGTLLEVTRNWRDFADIVATCNERTPHLRYSWQPCDGAPAADVLERVGAYCRIARLAAHYSHFSQS